MSGRSSLARSLGRCDRLDHVTSIVRIETGVSYRMRSAHPPWQFTFRGFLIANLYLAVLMAPAIHVMRAPAPERLAEFGRITILVMPSTIWLLSRYTLQPGASRDFLVGAFHIGSVLVLAFLCSWPILNGLRRVIFESASLTQVVREFTITFMIIASVLYPVLWFVSWKLVAALIPRTCPACNRRRLVNTKLTKWYMFGSGERHYWCAGCGWRCKRSKKGPVVWADASHPNEDEFYWLDRPLRWFDGRAQS